MAKRRNVPSSQLSAQAAEFRVNTTQGDTPAALGYHMPAEWEPHAATWIAWPHNRSDWPGKFEPIPWIYADIVRHLADAERVEILVNDAAAERAAREVLRRSHVSLDAVRFHRIPTNRGWVRDYGPIFVTGKAGCGVVKWSFNGWAKYNDWKKDERAGGTLVEKLGLPAWLPSAGAGKGLWRMVLEGGSIDVNGHGTLLTTEECLLSRVQQRNPGVSRAQLEDAFAQFLGVKKVIWLERGIEGDDTHGHIDDTARFVAPDTVVAAVETNRRDSNYARLQENLKVLEKATDQDGRPLRVIELPMPAPVYFRGQRLPASYANFYIANGIVLVPAFNDPNDRVALNTLADLFPSRHVIPIYCRDLVLGLGTLHCMTQQQPR